MKTLPILRFQGIAVKLHWSFLLIFIWIGYVGISRGLSLTETIYLGIAVLGMFGFVVMHEYGHALTARHFGIKTRDIILLPIGGVARLEKMPRNPWQEFAIAIAGPLVNLFWAGVFWLALYYSQFEFRASGEDALGSFLNPKGLPFLFFAMNLSLFLFNLLPAFPMDGGRILRALLALRMGYEQATLWAARIGQVMAMLFIFYSVMTYNIILTFIGIFIFYTAGLEYEIVRRITGYHGLTLKDIMRTDFITFKGSDPISAPIERYFRGGAHSYIITDSINGRPSGVIRREDLFEALQSGRWDSPISDWMHTAVFTFDQDTPVNAITEKAAGISDFFAAVTADSHIVGIIDDTILYRLYKLKPFLPLYLKMRKDLSNRSLQSSSSQTPTHENPSSTP